MGANRSGKRHIDRLKRRRKEEKRLAAKLATQTGHRAAWTTVPPQPGSSAK